MRNRGFKIVLLALAAAGGVVAWQRKNETPPVAPALRPAEPFMDPVERSSVRPPTAVSTSGDAVVSGGPAVEAGVVVDARDEELPDDSDGDLADRPQPLPHPPIRPFTTAPEGPADDLKRISGIGPKLEQLLNREGITTFAQLAALDDEGIDRLQSRMDQFPGRVRRDSWVDQAKRLQGT